MNKLTHFDDGKPLMVDVAGTDSTDRMAVARGQVHMRPETLQRILDKTLEKGNVFDVARLAGIMAAKKTPELIPLCHPLLLNRVEVDFSPDEKKSLVHIEAKVKVYGKTGVEMEALTAVTVAALTIYDMCKSIDKFMTITHILLVEKSGGQSGHFILPTEDAE